MNTCNQYHNVSAQHILTPFAHYNLCLRTAV